MSTQSILENRRLESMPAVSLGQIVLVSQQHPELFLWLLESGKAPRFQSADDMLQSILEALAEVTASSRAAVMLLDVGERTLAIKAAVGLSGEAIENTRTRLGEGIAGWVAQKRTALLLPGGPDIPPRFGEMMAREGITTALYVPLEVEGVVFGVLDLARQGDVSAFTPQDLWFVRLIADRLAGALYGERLKGQVESLERFITRIQESIPSSLVVIDRSLRIVSANRNFLEKGRREARTTLGRKIEEVFPQVLLEFTHLDQKMREVFRTGQPVEGGKLAYRAPGLPGRIYYYRLIPLYLPPPPSPAKRREEKEGVENVMLLMDDITEREQLGEEVRHAGRHLGSVVECANDLVISLDSDGRIVTWNRAAESTSGLKAEQVKGQLLLSLCAIEQQSVMAELLRRLARGKSVQNTEVNLLTASGQEVPIAWNCSPMRDDAGKVVGIVAVGRDLTERRRLEAQLSHSAKMASLGVMAGGIAHEVRNPLGIISASAQLLLERPDDARLRSQGLEKIYAATQRASLIIENLLKFARPQDSREKETDIRAVLEETLALLTHQMTLQKVTLKREFQQLPHIYANPELLQQVFTNLILNACNAMPQGGTLTIATQASGQEEILVRFGDSGHGIPQEQLPMIFDPFFTTMPIGKGTGLGLSICYSIISQHQGTIEVESQVGQGSTFTVRLPTIANGR
ncbi:MAG: PAS domain-containing protein [Chloroflexi bacterium]|nr:PAS domain-containing protein [Chloroflexota bacterium]